MLKKKKILLLLRMNTKLVRNVEIFIRNKIRRSVKTIQRNNKSIRSSSKMHSKRNLIKKTRKFWIPSMF